VPSVPLPVPVETPCTLWRADLPTDFEVVAGGAYQGKALGFAIDESGHQATVFDVLVNLPGRSVVLMLGAYEFSVWTVRWTPGTKIVGAWVSGYYGPQVTGLPADAPVLRTAHPSTDTCPSFYITENNDTLGTAAFAVLERTPERAVLASGDGRLVFGRVTSLTSVEQGPVVAPETFRLAGVPRSGDAGLDELVAQRVLRVATDRDVNDWRAFARGRNQLGQAQYATFGHRDLSGNPSRTFVVLAPITFPAGLTGAHRATFIVQRGVARPTGNPGHSTILTYE